MKKIIINNFGSSVVLILLQLLTGLKTEGSLPYLIGANLFLTTGILVILDGIIKIIKIKHKKRTR